MGPMKNSYIFSGSQKSSGQCGERIEDSASITRLLPTPPALPHLRLVHTPCAGSKYTQLANTRYKF